MCASCELLAAGEIDLVTADVCDDAENGIPYVPGGDADED